MLVVEDNIINQKVAGMILQSFGCRVEVAANGREGLESIDTLPFDIIFMDCEMPEMDGYEATATIRSRADAKRNLPVVAVTAKATQGERERCLEAGMDDYMSKPVRAEDFQAMLERWVAGRKNEIQLQSETANAPDEVPQAFTLQPALDAEVIATLRGLAEATDASLLDQILESFLSDGIARLSILRAAQEKGDAETLHKAAHALKGASANIGAWRMAEISQELQALGEDETVEGAAVEGAAVLIDQSEAAFERVQTEIAAEQEKLHENSHRRRRHDFPVGTRCDLKKTRPRCHSDSRRATSLGRAGQRTFFPAYLRLDDARYGRSRAVPPHPRRKSSAIHLHYFTDRAQWQN